MLYVTEDLSITEPEMMALAKTELNKNYDLVKYAVNVKLGNFDIYDPKEIREMLDKVDQLMDASTSLVQHTNNMYAELQAMIANVASKFAESEAKATEATAKYMMASNLLNDAERDAKRIISDAEKEAERIKKEAQKESIPWYYKATGAILSVVAFAFGTNF